MSQDTVIKIKITNWLRDYLTEAREDGLNDLINLYGIGEVNTILLADALVYDSGLIPEAEQDEIIDDETHFVWDLIMDAAKWYEGYE